MRPDYPLESDGNQYKNNVITHMIGFADSNVQDDPLLLRTAQQGGGRFLAAADASTLVTAFNDIITDILERSGSFASAAVSSTTLNTGTRLFQAGFNASNWSGELRALPISSGPAVADGPCPTVARGRLCPQPTDPNPVVSTAPTGTWNAATSLNNTAPASRHIVTFNRSTKAGIPFRWASLPSAQQSLLNRDPNVLPTLFADTKGEMRLNYLRGDRTNEGAGKFRPRSGRLGDIVDSDPVFVGAPNASLPLPGYSAFRNAKAGRTPVIYVGANDGMLHGFRAGDGAEVIAYVPGSLYGTNSDPKLARLTALPYSHVYGVDGSPTVADIQVGSTLNWASYLVGTMRYGAQGIFALDVTDPASFSENNAASIVKWEFTDSDDADLGYTFSQPSIVKLKNGKWAAIVGNGYNNRETGNASTNGQAALFVLYMDGPGADGVWNLGTDYLKFLVGSPTPVTDTDNGLSTPSVVDLNGDNIADFVYAGDLLGRVWQFNLDCVLGESGCTWGAGLSGEPLFTAKSNAGVALPITAPPEVGFNLLTGDSNDIIVYVGTGRYFVTGDNTRTNQQNQTFYGIFADPTNKTVPSPNPRTDTSTFKDKLLRQKVLLEDTVNGNSIRVSTANKFAQNAQGDIALTVSSAEPAKGWYIDLYNVATAGTDPTPLSKLNKGERHVNRPLIRDGRIIFTTLIPSELPCEFGGSGWLMELDAKTGARPSRPVLDITNNLVVAAEDVYTTTIDGQQVTIPVTGIGSPTGMLSTPAVLSLGEGTSQEAKYLVRSDGTTLVIGEAASGRVGRVTWREIME